MSPDKDKESEMDDMLLVFKKYWKIILKWFLRIHNYPEITVDQLYSQLNSDKPPVLIDVRSIEDYKGTGHSSYGHIPEALSIPILELESRMDELGTDKEREIVAMCPGGGMSLAAVDVLIENGFQNAKSLKDGTDLWHKKGYPLVKA